MRVISGERRGMTLIGPRKSQKTRPTRDQVKETVFDILGPIRQGLTCLDLFAGSGQIGIEFLSRGCDFAIFVEQSGPMVGVIKENLKKTRYEDRSLILHGDYRRRLDDLGRKVDLVYLDPPYRMKMVEEALDLITKKRILTPGAILVVESSSEEEITIPPAFTVLRHRVHKFNQIQILKELDQCE
ncbi:16S rRNA (guanine(966)-N(2))-methyltransferase RsmD [Kallipyga gabonensis]|uniref:16S rRNA (guanine(966)-N(2))-methyltransferase RsmD n=1 Tax=Kallipyga gabonensis TaxID=1686287 RepID=UPI0006B5F78C|nr:16S rRNA (guanine(966)-N(2))-methyltransferase RsmD [Kallipyga gabonensis]